MGLGMLRSVAIWLREGKEKGERRARARARLRAECDSENVTVW